MSRDSNSIIAPLWTISVSGKMAAQDKAFVGRELRDRTGIAGAGSVGAWWASNVWRPEAGCAAARFCSPAAEPVAGHGRGYITSVTWSTELKKYIALGLYRADLSMRAAEVVCAYPLKGEQVRARIVSPVFIDKQGERLRV